VITYPRPRQHQLEAAFGDHGVRFVEGPKCNAGRDTWANGLRAITMHHTAGRNSLGTLQSFTWAGANVLIQNGIYNGRANDGLLIVLCWGSCWHTGAGGPWKGVAGEDSLHLTSWGCEVESLGGHADDITDAQAETAGRMLAALWSLGVPRDHTHRHADWTDGTDPVGGHPLPTLGRKIDTRQEWAPTSYWLRQGERWVHPVGLWDGQVPSFDGVKTSEVTDIPNPASWRLACRLADLGHYVGVVRPRGEQRYPERAVKAWQKAKGYKPTGIYGPVAHERLFGVTPG
jgi:hypothetical protein